MNARNCTVFLRNWWKVNKNGNWPNNLEPNSDGKKTIIRKGLTVEEAREFCREYNATHDPGRLSRKAEFTS